MSDVLLFATLGLASGVAFAGVGLGVVVVHRASGVVNLAQAAFGMWAAFTFHELRATGALVVPVPGVPDPTFGGPLPVWAAAGLALVMAAGLAAVAYLAVFGPMRAASVVARVVASAGVLTVVQSLVGLRFGTTGRVVEPIVPTGTVELAGAALPVERLFAAAIAVAVAVALMVWYRASMVGLASRAAAENELDVALLGWAPNMLGLVSWVLAAVVTGTLSIVAAFATGLNSAGFALLIVPGLAAALAGRLASPAVTCVAALALGALQSLATYFGSRPGWPGWASTGIAQLVAFGVVACVLFATGKRLPVRGDPPTARLPAVPRRPLRPAIVALASGAGLAGLVLTGGSYRFGLITSCTLAIVALSLVVLTGLVGQVSFAHAAIAGIAGFTLAKLGDRLPFPVSLFVAVGAAALAGVVVGVPALRIRGSQLAVISLAAAVALEQFVFRNPSFTDQAGEPIPPPAMLGVDLAVRRGTEVARLSFGVFVLVMLVAVAWGVSNLARSPLGRRLLTVRADEAAAAAAGIDVGATKLVAYTISAAIAGLGGALIGYSRGQLSADSFVVFVGIGYVVAAYLGGITNVAGAIVAGLIGPLGILYVLSERHLSAGRWYLLASGAALLAVLVARPDGLAGGWRRASPRPTVTPRSGVIPPADVTPHMPAALRVRGLTVRHGGVTAVVDLDLTVGPGEIVGLIGPNGAGKTSTIDAISGFSPALGTVHVGESELTGCPAHTRQRAGLARTWQTARLVDDLTALENIAVAADRPAWGDTVRAVLVPGSQRRDDLIELLALFDAAGIADHPAAQLSPGERKLVDLCRALAARPSVLLADEPAAGLNTAESERLGAHLRCLARSGVAVLLVEHDLGMVRRVCDRIVVLDYGRVIAAGPTAAVLADRAVAAAYLGRAPGEPVGAER